MWAGAVAVVEGDLLSQYFRAGLGGALRSPLLMDGEGGCGREAGREVVAYARPQGRKKCMQGNWSPSKERRAMLSLPLRVMSGKIHQDRDF